MSRRLLALTLLLAIAGSTRADLAWHDARSLTVEGQGFTDTAAPYDRLPARAEGIVRTPVWNLSRHSAGILVRFVTDATAIHARWTLTGERLDMAHMARSAVSGVDLYVRHDDGWRWLGASKPEALSNEQRIVSGLEPVGSGPAGREFMMYLPLYNGTAQLEIGVDESATMTAAKPRDDKPIVFYGTSITHGACASRPGMTHVAILGRRLDRPVINLGFSGNGRMDAELVDFFAEIDAAVYVIDCLPNMNADTVTVRAEPFVRALRATRPDTPIVLVEDRRFANSDLRPARRRFHDRNHAALRQAYENMSDVDGLFYLEGDDLLGDDGDGTVDGSHPTDLGFWRQANAFEPVLRRALEAGAAPVKSLADIDWPSWQATDIATLVFIVADDEVLLIRKKRGLGAGKINGPGGKCDPGESPHDCAVRETEEELCITPRDLVHHGENRFQFADGYSIHVHVYVAHAFDGTPTETDEAVPLWTRLDAIPYHEMWADDDLWLPHVLAGRTVDGWYIFDGDAMVDQRVEVVG